MENEVTQECEPIIAVRCKTCNKILAFKSGSASGYLQLKCPLCKSVIRVNLSLRRGRVFNRQTRTPLTLTFPNP